MAEVGSKSCPVADFDVIGLVVWVLLLQFYLIM
jgi:hypothetical protein